jgi:hypothetical protein
MRKEERDEKKEKKEKKESAYTKQILFSDDVHPTVTVRNGSNRSQFHQSRKHHPTKQCRGIECVFLPSNVNRNEKIRIKERAE